MPENSFKNDDMVQVRRSDYFRDYLRHTSFSMALLRGVECNMFAGLEYRRPVLDLGCGDGLFASILFDDVIDNGLDISESEIRLARESGMYGSLEIAKAANLPYPDDHFSTIYSNCVIEHLDDLDDSFIEACRVLKPGGSFYITTHSDKYRRYFFYSSLLKKLGIEKLGDRYSQMWVDLWSHYNCLPGDEWIGRLKKAGFSTVDATPYFPRRGVFLFDLALPLAAPSYITRKITGKWKIFPRTITLTAAETLGRKLGRDLEEGDWCYLLLAHK